MSMDNTEPEASDQVEAPETLEERAARKAAKRDSKAAAKRETAVPRNVRMVGKLDYSRARPRQKPVEVTRAWPGVKNGQLVVLHPAHQKRLLRGGFVKEV
jgi:hypothetical protein